jgi:hypothetical protein
MYVLHNIYDLSFEIHLQFISVCFSVSVAIYLAIHIFIFICLLSVSLSLYVCRAYTTFEKWKVQPTTGLSVQCVCIRLPDKYSSFTPKFFSFSDRLCDVTYRMAPAGATSLNMGSSLVHANSPIPGQNSILGGCNGMDIAMRKPDLCSVVCYCSLISLQPTIIKAIPSYWFDLVPFTYSLHSMDFPSLGVLYAYSLEFVVLVIQRSTVTARSKAWTVFPAWMLESWARIPLEASMCACLIWFCVVLCVCRDLATGSSNVWGVLPTLQRVKKLKRWLRTNKRAVEPLIVINMIIFN